MLQAQAQAHTELAERGFVRPAAFMLVHRNPQTGAPLAHPTAIATILEHGDADQETFAGFVSSVQREADRLKASAVAISGEAEAEVEGERGPELKRVVLIRLETARGIELMHAAVEDRAGQEPRLGPFLASGDAQDDITESMIPGTGVTQRLPPRSRE